MRQMLVGIDEVGRGPLAGPVTVCAVVVRRILPRGFFKDIHDSKALSGQARLLWYKKAIDARKAGAIDFATASMSARYIDVHGIGSALRAAIRRALARLQLAPSRTKVLLDGSLKAPVEFKKQRTIIKGDEKIPVIALASIIAKVRRDALMYRHAKEFPHYGFEAHVGYGTARHYRAIRSVGLCRLHRVSFLTNLRESH